MDDEGTSAVRQLASRIRKKKGVVKATAWTKRANNHSRWALVQRPFTQTQALNPSHPPRPTQTPSPNPNPSPHTTPTG